jgi:hypothetical protein
MKMPEKATLLKLIAAAIVPGGFIIWGLHELSVLRRKRDNMDSKEVPQGPDKTGAGD